jgi:hypothetical protein|tara:strand:- start:197 stop:472 length:276 start_codon:yes stop_codon:yes gene_type:complete
MTVNIRNALELIRYYIFGVPYCIGIVVWYTVTLRPSEGLFHAALHTVNQFFKHVAVYENADVVHLYNKESDLLKSMQAYVEEATSEETGEN